jgi:hypothetical protein
MFHDNNIKASVGIPGCRFVDGIFLAALYDWYGFVVDYFV